MSYYDYYFDTEPTDLVLAVNRLKNRLIYRAISESLDESAGVLELGAGRGFFGFVCQEAGRDYDGVEAHSAQCRKLAEAGLSVKPASVPPIPFEAGRFGLVYASHLLEHLSGPREVFDLFSECHRVLREGGVLAVLFPNYLRMGRVFWDADYTHQFATTEERIRQLLRDTNFRHLKTVKFRGHYTGLRRHLAGLMLTVCPRPVLAFILRFVLPADVVPRAWLHLQEDILVVAKRQS